MSDTKPAETQANASAQQVSKPAKYKPPPKPMLFAGLEFSLFAQYIVKATLWMNLVFGIVAIVTGVANRRYLDLACGIYALAVIPLFVIWDTIRSFTGIDKSTDAFLEGREWPQFIRYPLSFCQHYLLQSLVCFLLSVFCFFSFQTAICGGGFVIAGIVYLLGFFHRENPKPITGIK